jgi:hypothetical protein
VHKRLTPIILATWEAEIKKITIHSQPGQIVHETLSQKNLTHKKNRAGRVVQVVKCLLRKYEALSSNPSNAERGKKKVFIHS